MRGASPERNRRRVDQALAQIGLLHQRLDARSQRQVELIQPALHQRAIFAEQRHHIRHRAQRHQIEQILFDLFGLRRRKSRPPLLGHGTQHGLRQPISHAHPASRS